jgi:hypothetical protein
MIGSDYLQIGLQFGRILLLQFLLSWRDVWQVSAGFLISSLCPGFGTNISRSLLEVKRIPVKTACHSCSRFHTCYTLEAVHVYISTSQP